MLTSPPYPFKSWNPITGCTKISPECLHCYAEKISTSLHQQGHLKYKNGFTPTLHPEHLQEPLKWKNPAFIFICSMSDLFHQDIPFSFIHNIIDTVEQANHHQYMILTKRAERMQHFFQERNVPDHIRLGVTIGVRSSLYRLQYLKNIEANTRFINCEPLLEDLGALDLSGIHWVNSGGENAAQARPTKKEWVLSLRDQCLAQNVPFMFKQWGTWGEDGVKRSSEENGNLVEGISYLAEPPYHSPQSEFLF